jgi:hypothetical protein
VIFLHRYRLFYGWRRKCPGGVHVEHFSSRLSSHDDSGGSLIWIETLASIILSSTVVIFEIQTTRLNGLEDEGGFPHAILMVNLDLYTGNCSTSRIGKRREICSNATVERTGNYPTRSICILKIVEVRRKISTVRSPRCQDMSHRQCSRPPC